MGALFSLEEGEMYEGDIPVKEQKLIKNSFCTTRSNFMICEKRRTFIFFHQSNNFQEAY